MIKDQREGTLPKWAQRRLQRLREQCAQLEVALNTALCPKPTGPTNVVLRRAYRVGGDHDDVPLGDNARIVFFAGTHYEIEAIVNASSRFVELRSNSSSYLFVLPNAANTISVCGAFTDEHGNR